MTIEHSNTASDAQLADGANDENEHAPIISCACCAKTFFGFAPEQADGCATDVYADCIYGHYGSAIADMTYFHFMPEKLPHAMQVGAQICDDCITALMADGTLNAAPQHMEPAELARMNCGICEVDADDEHAPIVTCGCCTQTFTGFAPGQADGCAADVHEDGIHGHYGSAVADMSYFFFASGKVPDKLTVDTQICDNCITALIGDGTLNVISEHTALSGAAAQAAVGVDLSALNLVELK